MGLIIQEQSKRIVIENVSIIKEERGPKKKPKEVNELIRILEQMYDELIESAKKYR